jgi:hypothetical protein
MPQMPQLKPDGTRGARKMYPDRCPAYAGNHLNLGEIHILDKAQEEDPALVGRSPGCPSGSTSGGNSDP